MAAGVVVSTKAEAGTGEVAAGVAVSTKAEAARAGGPGGVAVVVAAEEVVAAVGVVVQKAGVVAHAA